MEHRCPICRKPTDSRTNAEFPFCSERCQLHDLGNWAAEKYTISEPAFDDSLFDDADPTRQSSSPSDGSSSARTKDGRKN